MSVPETKVDVKGGHFMHRFTTFISIITAAAFFGCSSSDDEPINLGEDPPEITGERLSDYAATWEGYTEAYAFPSGTDRVRLILNEDGTGILVVGDDAPDLPVPTDPNVGPGLVSERPPQWLVLEGFRYSVHATRVDDRRLRLGAERREPYLAWCELQTPYLVFPEVGYYQCLPDGSTRGSGDGTPCGIKPKGDGEWAPVDCEKLSLCGVGANACTCDAAGCTVPMSDDLDDQTLRLDGALFAEGAELVGTLVMTDRGNETMRATVRFTRN